MPILYISPTGSGTHNGFSAANAGTIYDLPKFIRAAGAGGQVRLLADKGAYKVTRQIAIANGGTAAAPVNIHGVNSSGQPMKATFLGTRAVDWAPGRASGNELFRLLSGANHLKFTDLTTKNFGNGVFRIGGNLQNLTIQRVSASNVTRFVENHPSSGATSASVNGLKVLNVTVSGYSQNAIRLKGNSSNITLQNIVGDSMRQNGGLYIHGVSLAGTVHNVLLDHVTMKNNYGRGSSTQYWNGDGFVAESGTYNLTFRDTYASGNTDAGYDIKANHVTMIRAQASANTKNFRFWGTDVTVTDSVSSDPRYYGGKNKATHFHGAGPGGTDVTLDNFRYSGSPGVLVFDLSNGGSTIKLIDTAMPSASLIRLGAGSTLTSGGAASINAMAAADALRVSATAAADVLSGGAGSDRLVGDSLNNTITGGAGNDRLIGAAGNDKLIGGVGNDWLNGGAGNDTLAGGEGSDTYSFGRGGGHDTIYNGDTGTSPDRLQFGAGITEDQLWFGKNGSDLLVTLRGTGGSDSVRLKGWSSASSNQLSNFQLSDGSVLTASHVQSLVQAMAAFTNTSGTPISLTNTQEQKVETTIAANWT